MLMLHQSFYYNDYSTLMHFDSGKFQAASAECRARRWWRQGQDKCRRQSPKSAQWSHGIAVPGPRLPMATAAKDIKRYQKGSVHSVHSMFDSCMQQNKATNYINKWNARERSALHQIVLAASDHIMSHHYHWHVIKHKTHNFEKLQGKAFPRGWSTPEWSPERDTAAIARLVLQ